MTATVTAQRPAVDRSAGLGGTPTAGTGALLKFGLRRERIPMGAWIYGIAIIAFSTVTAFAKLYPDPLSRADFARSLGTQPVFAVLTGKIFDSSLGGLTAWRITLLGGVLAGLMSMFTVIRRTRTDEEAGRTELLVSAAIGRAAPLFAGILCAVIGCLGIGVLVAAILGFEGESLTGSIALGLTIAGSGLMFAGVAAVAAQLFDGARAALGITGLVLGVSFAIRAIADAGGDGTAWLRWLSPLGWAENVEAFAANRFTVIGLMLLTTLALIAVALLLLGRRDVGLGMFPARLGVANGTIGSPLGLASRLQLPSAIGWAVALAAFGAVTGGIIDSAKSLVADNKQMSDILAKIGGPGVLTNAVLGALVGICAILASIAAVSAAGRLVTEEQTERAALVLASPVARSRWQASHVLFVLIVPAVVMALAGLTCGVLHGIRSGDFGGGFGDSMRATLAQIPACWVIGGVAVVVHAVAPRLWVTSWILLVIGVVIAQLGPILQFPRLLTDLSPFPHVATVATSGVPWLAEFVLTAISAALLALGFAGFRRRGLSTR